MIIGIYNIRPKENCYLAEYLQNKRFVLDTEDYDDWFGYQCVEGTSEWKDAVGELIDICLERRRYGKWGVNYEWSELKASKDGRYYFANQPLQDFGNFEMIEQVTHKEQMELIWQEILPVITKMAEAYPDIKTEPVFDYQVDPETKGVVVKLKELKFTVKN